MLPRRFILPSCTTASSYFYFSSSSSRCLLLAPLHHQRCFFSLLSSTRPNRAINVETIRPEEIILEVSSSSTTTTTTSSSTGNDSSSSSSATKTTTSTSKIFTYSSATATFVESYDFDESGKPLPFDNHHHGNNHPNDQNNSLHNNNDHSKTSSSSSSHHHNQKAHHHHQNNHHHDHHNFEEVTSVDTFAKGKVFNYLKKMNPDISRLKNSSDLFKMSEEREIQEDGSEIILVKCRLRITLPHPHNSATAQGTAQTDKDAEYLCTMHAQRILDALGIPMFSLSSMQKRHAEAARSQGRYAPLPGEKMKPQGTPLPPPLKMAMVSQEAATNKLKHPTVMSKQERNSLNHGDELDLDDPEIRKLNEESNRLQNKINKENHLAAQKERDEKKLQQQNYQQQSKEKEKQPIPPPKEATNKDDESNKTTTPTSTSSSSNEAKTATTPPATNANNNRPIPDIPDDIPSETIKTTSSTNHPLQNPLHAVPEGATMIQQLYYLSPWVFAAAHRPPPLASNVRDATEGGAFQLVNVLSTRCSGSKYAISLPCVFDKSSLERIKDCFNGLFKNLNKKVEKEMKLAHLLVPGSMQRMYVAELNLTDFIQEGLLSLQKGSPSDHDHKEKEHLLLLVDHLKRFVSNSSGGNKVIARGKASDTGEAMFLCGMHAELLMDYFSIPLFPLNKEKQSQHALHALENGRWATGFDFALLPKDIQEQLIMVDQSSSSSSSEPKTSTTTATRKHIMKFISGVRGPPTEDGLEFCQNQNNDNNNNEKQENNNDHNNNIEWVLEEDVPVPAPLKQLTGAIGDAEGLPALGRAQHRSVTERMVMLHNELGNSITEMQECNPDLSMARESMRAVRQFQLDRGSFYRSHYVITQMGEAYKASMILPVIENVGVQGGVGVGRNPQHATELCALHAVDVLNWLEIPVYGHDIEKQRDLANKRKALRLSYFYHPEDPVMKNDHLVKDAAITNDGDKSSTTTTAEESKENNNKKKIFKKPPPGLQWLEALGANRALCPDYLVRKIQQLKIFHAFDVMREFSDTELIEKGNRDKMAVTQYLQRTKQNCVPFVIQLNMQKNSLHMHCVATIEFSVFITPDNCPQPFSVHMNEKQLKVHSDKIVALGASLKRKDADRCLFLHIASILRKYGVKLEKEEAYAAAERRRLKAGGVPSSPMTGAPTPLPGGQQGQQPLTKKQMKRLRAEKEEQERKDKERQTMLAKETPEQRAKRIAAEAEEETKKQKEKEEAEEKERLKKIKEEEEMASLHKKYADVEIPRPIMHRLLDDMLRKDLSEKNARAQKAKMMQQNRSNYF